jgi:biotin carboxyl carrier protein
MIALIEKENSLIRVLSPAVGFYSEMPKENVYLSGGAMIGRLTVLNTNFLLYLPDDVNGIVKYEQMPDRMIHVGYGDELFRLSIEEINLKGEKSAAKKGQQNEKLTEKGYVIRAFTTGIFYRKPSPDAAPYVEEGQKIEKGKVLGLIEVMKTFNHIVFQGTENSNKGIVKKILVGDGQEVKLNQPLFVIE